MIVVIILRWFFGYISFSVEGRFPERFINLAAKRGINLWKLKGTDEKVSGCARMSDLKSLRLIAERNGHKLHIERGHGLPHLIIKYRSRSGLLAGMIICIALYIYMSGSVWNITFTLPDSINEYEIRNTLKEYGLYEGARVKSINVDDIVNSISSKDRRISWMTINISGTDAEVNISPNISDRVKKNEGIKLSNMLSSADGTVTRVNVYNGSADVKAGDGIRKGQLLVSGIVEYNNGINVFTDSEAVVFAKTARRVRIEIPKSSYNVTAAGETEKNDISFFGLILPSSMHKEPEGERTVITERNQFSLLGHGLPVYSTKEKWQMYEKKPVTLTLSQAEKGLRNKLELYEIFMLAETDKGTVLKRDYSIKETKDSFVLEGTYEIEENVCQKVVIQMQEDQTQQSQS